MAMNEDRKIDLEYFNILFQQELLEELPPDMLPCIEDFRRQILEMQEEEESDIRFSIDYLDEASES